MFANATGNNTFQASSISLSPRIRGNEIVNHIYKKKTRLNFNANQIGAGINDSAPIGGSHPPKNNTVVSDAIANTYTYSASIKNAKRKPEYSIWKPEINSDSASGKSKGVRFNSATEAIRKTTNATGCKKINQTFSCAYTMSFKFKLPVMSTIPRTDITSGIS